LAAAVRLCPRQLTEGVEEAARVADVALPR